MRTGTVCETKPNRTGIASESEPHGTGTACKPEPLEWNRGHAAFSVAILAPLALRLATFPVSALAPHSPRLATRANCVSPPTALPRRLHRLPRRFFGVHAQVSSLYCRIAGWSIGLWGSSGAYSSGAYSCGSHSGQGGNHEAIQQSCAQVHVCVHGAWAGPTCEWLSKVR